MTDPLARAAALHQRGVAATASMRPAVGGRHLRAALALLDPATMGGAAELRGRILLSLGHAEAEQGNIDAGWQLLAQAERLIPPGGRGVLYGQRALLLRRTGRHEAAVADFDASVALLRTAVGPAAPANLARALLNRGVLYLDTGRLRPARADLLECVGVGQRGHPPIVPMARQNLAFLDFLAGDIPSALGGYAAVAAEYSVTRPGILPVLALDRARALLAAGLFGEADRQLAGALDGLRRQRLGQDHAEAQLARAEAALLAGHPPAARRWADRARAGFLRRGNERWAGLATLLVLRADLAALLALRMRGPAVAERAAGLAERARALAMTLDRHGLTEDGRVAELLAVRALAAGGQVGEAAAVLHRRARPGHAERLDTRLLRRLARTEVDAAGHVAAAVTASRPRRADASRQLIAGLAEVREHRARFGSLDLQTSASVYGRELATYGLGMALRSGSPAEVYRWSERARAQALLLTAVRPPDSGHARAIVEELRQLRAVLRTRQLSGQSRDGIPARAVALQRALREHAWSAPGPGAAGGLATLSSIRAELADAALVVYLRDGAALHALVVTAASTTLVPVGRAAAAEQAVLRLRADLDVAAGRALSTRLASAVAQATRRDAEAVAAALLRPLGDRIGARELVVVPTGLLVTLPWGALPDCAGRTVTVAGSASTWLAARTRRRDQPARGPTVLVAGPGIARGGAEIRAIAKIRPHARVLTGSSASPPAVLAALDGAATAHLAAHGTHEADNALFSSLELAGGPLMGYDLQYLRAVPETVVLSSCDLGLSDVRPGDETLGITTALLAAGACTVVASVSRVADDAAMTIMTAYHRESAHGRAPAAAMAEALGPNPAAGFVCFGAG